MTHILIHTLIHSLKLIPILLITFFIIEIFEHKKSEKLNKLLKNQKKYAPFFGSILGVIPQCGFSVMATELYIKRIITLGTLISIYLTTSDEMLPVLISENADIKLILFILGIKILVGIISGVIIDLILRKKDFLDFKTNNKLRNFKHDDKFIMPIFKRTTSVFIFIFIISFKHRSSLF